MEKIEFPNKEYTPKPKVSGFLSKIFGVIKFVFGVCLLPFVYSLSVSLLNEFNLIEKSIQNYFWSGVIFLLIVYLFIWEPAIFYAKGQKLLELIFIFFKPLVKVAPYLLPVYTILLLAIYPAISLSKSALMLNYFIFLLGASIALHLIFSAKSIRSRKNDFLKANYIFGFSFIYIVNLALLAFSFSLIFKEFSFVNFSNNSFQVARDIFYAVFKQLFTTA